MELNGLASIVQQIWAMQKDESIQQVSAQNLLAKIELLDRYMVAYGHNPAIKWHEVRDNPLAYETLSQQQTRMLKEAKEARVRKAEGARFTLCIFTGSVYSYYNLADKVFEYYLTPFHELPKVPFYSYEKSYDRAAVLIIDGVVWDIFSSIGDAKIAAQAIKNSGEIPRKSGRFYADAKTLLHSE